MTLRKLSDLLRESSPTIMLMSISNLFFIFLAWVAYPKTFRVLVGSMVLFTIVSIVFGMWLIWKRQAKKEKYFYAFLREPSTENEDRLISSNSALHQGQVKGLADRLRMLNDSLEESKLQSLDYEEFIESWVHEIKPPISLMTLVLQNRKEEMSELVHQRLEHARITICDDVEQILFYARLQASHIDYRFERTSLVQCTEDVMLELQTLLQEKEVRVISKLEDIIVISDEKAMEFIIKQICVNAIKYSSDKSEKFIWIETGYDGNSEKYYLKIYDNGIGVHASDLPFLFDKGFTGDNAKDSKSTGIGLYLVKKLCDQLQIEIEVESTYGKGFLVQLFFPIIEV